LSPDSRADREALLGVRTGLGTARPDEGEIACRVECAAPDHGPLLRAGTLERLDSHLITQPQDAAPHEIRVHAERELQSRFGALPARATPRVRSEQILPLDIHARQPGCLIGSVQLGIRVGDQRNAEVQMTRSTLVCFAGRLETLVARYCRTVSRSR
jgi:hypothetical protein